MTIKEHVQQENLKYFKKLSKPIENISIWKKIGKCLKRFSKLQKF
jgi:hypothetical protein